MFGEIHNVHGERLDYTFTASSVSETAETAELLPGGRLVVIGHGVTANKDRPFLAALAEALGAVGIPSLRVSFSGNGGSDGRFVDSNITKEVEELGVVLQAVVDARDDARILYVGHSMGGAVGVLRAAADSRIRALVSLAGMVHTRDFAERKFGDLRPGRDCMWDKPECPLSQAFVDDLTSIDSVVETGAAIHVPWLLVHGLADEVVSPHDSRDIRAAAGGRPHHVELPGVDHVFTGPGTEAMTAAVVPWIAAVEL